PRRHAHFGRRELAPINGPEKAIRTSQGCEIAPDALARSLPPDAQPLASRESRENRHLALAHFVPIDVHALAQLVRTKCEAARMARPPHESRASSHAYPQVPIARDFQIGVEAAHGIVGSAAPENRLLKQDVAAQKPREIYLWLRDIRILLFEHGLDRASDPGCAVRNRGDHRDPGQRSFTFRTRPRKSTGELGEGELNRCERELSSHAPAPSGLARFLTDECADTFER